MDGAWLRGAAELEFCGLQQSWRQWWCGSSGRSETGTRADADRSECVPREIPGSNAAYVFPNGQPLYTNEGDDETIWGENRFAVTDIDGDGIDELLIDFGNAPMAGEQFYVFQYEPDGDTFREELSEFPAVEFYEGGYLTVQASHNQGLAGEFWPYAIYRYNAEQDIYEQFYYIYAWDKTYFSENMDGDPFPDDVDTCTISTRT